MVKNKKLRFAALFALIAAALLLTACADHEHVYEYEHDAAEHWQTCSVCREATEKSAHAFGEWETVTPATCTAAGSKKRVCSVCQAEDARDIAKIAHTYGEEIFYELQEGSVVSYTVCDCGAKSERTAVSNAVVATPETAQDALDRAGDDAVVYFSAGTYDQPLSLRQNKFASKVKKTNADAEYLQIDALQPTGVYCYYRNVNRLTLYGDAGAVFTQRLAFGSGHVYERPNPSYGGGYDAVRDVLLASTTTSYYNYLYVDGLTLKNMNFSGLNAYVDISMELADTRLNDFTVDRCKFDASAAAPADRGSMAAIHLITDVGGNYKNITIKNTEIDGYFQGFFVQNAENVSVVGNTVRNTTHNAIAVQSSNVGFSGTVIIRENRLEKIGNRAIRFGAGENASVIVENNRFVEINYFQLLKSQTLTGCDYAFRGNVYGDPGAAIPDVSGSGSTFLVSRPAAV